MQMIKLHPSGEALVVSGFSDSVFSWMLLFENENSARYAYSETKSRHFNSLVGFLAYIHSILGIEARYTLYPLKG